MGFLKHVTFARRWAAVLDIAIKIGTVVALLAAGYQYLLRTQVELVVNSARLLDPVTVQEEYKAYGQTVPPLVIDAVHAYVRDNLQDLAEAANSTVEKLPKSGLCATDAGFVEAVAGTGACEPGNTRALTKFYERKLLHDNFRAGRPLPPDQVRHALALLRRSEYRRYRACVRNVGSYHATDVEIFPSAGYKAAAGYDGPAFSLRPGEESVRDFVTEVGYLDGQPPATYQPEPHGGGGTTTSATSTTVAPADTTSTAETPAGTTATTYAPGAKERIEKLDDSVPAGSCLRKPGATDATFFSVDWKDNPERPGGPFMSIGLFGILGLLLVLFARRSTGAP
ncbi:MAG: hypothetical protein M3394_03940 [Actinomycetota bacterium]|nr:hypothetical protein [Actinomycetota bacterium]